MKNIRQIVPENMIQSFIKSESGAVTVDYVVLTAGIVGLAIAVQNTISSGMADLTADIAGTLRGDRITTAFLQPQSPTQLYSVIQEPAPIQLQSGIQEPIPTTAETLEPPWYEQPGALQQSGSKSIESNDPVGVRPVDQESQTESGEDKVSPSEPVDSEIPQ